MKKPYSKTKALPKALPKAQNGRSIYGDPSAYNNLDSGLDIMKSAGAAYLGHSMSSQAYFNAIMPNDPEEAKRRSQISAGVSGVIGGVGAALSLSGQRRDYAAYQKQIAQQQAGEYYRLPVDRYAYNEYLGNPYNQTAYKKGGLVKCDDGGEVGNDWETEDPELDMPEMDPQEEAPRQQVVFDSTDNEQDNNDQAYSDYPDYPDYESFSEDIFPENGDGYDLAKFTPTLGNIPTRLALQSDDIEKTIAGIGQHESGGNYGVVNTSGGQNAINATGKYQFVPKYWHKEIAQFQGTQGKSMEETMDYFKNNPQVQEGFMRHVVNKYYLPEVKTLLPMARQYGIDQEGLIKMLHYRGIDDTRKRLQTGNFEVSQKEKALYNNPDILSYVTGR